MHHWYLSCRFATGICHVGPPLATVPLECEFCCSVLARWNASFYPIVKGCQHGLGKKKACLARQLDEAFATAVTSSTGMARLVSLSAFCLMLRTAKVPLLPPVVKNKFDSDSGAASTDVAGSLLHTQVIGGSQLPGTVSLLHTVQLVLLSITEQVSPFVAALKWKTNKLFCVDGEASGRLGAAGRRQWLA